MPSFGCSKNFWKPFQKVGHDHPILMSWSVHCELHRLSQHIQWILTLAVPSLHQCASFWAGQVVALPWWPIDLSGYQCTWMGLFQLGIHAVFFHGAQLPTLFCEDKYAGVDQIPGKEQVSPKSSSLCQGLRYYRTVALAKEPAKSRPGHCDLDSPQPINCQCEMPHYNYLFMIIFLSSVCYFEGRVQNSRSWRSQVKSTSQITRNQGNTGYTRRHHNQASRIFNMIGCW